VRVLSLFCAIPLAFLAAAPAAACPPPEGPQPSVAEQARGIHGLASDIVYGVVLRPTGGPHSYRFRVLHAYKGALRPGQVITARATIGFNGARCGIMTPPPLARGRYGVVAFTGTTQELNFIDQAYLEAMFEAGLIRRASPEAIR
jgi:hypothetical protein